MQSTEPLPKEDWKWKRAAAAYVKGTLRRQADALLPSRETREYQHWIVQRQQSRKAIYTQHPHTGLFSILTPVWNGSPVRYLRALAESIEQQNRDGASEWVLLDNGCANPKLLECLQTLGERPWVRLLRSEENLGITRGLHRCLQEASGRYVLPVDADDLLHPDALAVIASSLEKAGYPRLLYTDEDKVVGSRLCQPYFKPDWDPVLLLNSAYIAHLGVIDRVTALELEAYSDPAVEGSPDWDLFLRFLKAGHSACHIPEVVYSWRVHASSTADDSDTKPYIASSQRRALELYFAARQLDNEFEIEPSALFEGGVHWHILQKSAPKPAWSTILLDDAGTTSRSIQRAGSDNTILMAPAEDPKQLVPQLHAVEQRDGFVAFLSSGLRIENSEWKAEALSVFALHPDTVMIGGRIQGPDGKLTSADLVFHFENLWGGPNCGRPADDPGYFGQLWKQRSVDAVSTQFAVMRVEFLFELTAQLPPGTSLGCLGLWAGAYAAQISRRVVYSPFLSGVSDLSSDPCSNPQEEALFRESYAGRLPKGRFYSSMLSATHAFSPLQPESI